MASIDNDIDESSAGIIPMFATYIIDTPISSDLSTPGNTDNVCDKYKILSMNSAGVPVGSIFAFDELSGP